MSIHHLDEETIFNVARRIEPASVREDYLEQICGDNPGLRARVEALLAVHDEEQEFMASPPSGLAPTTYQQPVTEGPGTIIGHYKLLQQIGEGGFGVVYMAEQQEPVRRKVALKIIKPGMDTQEVIARFEAERQALALMDHPNIARVLDAGSTASGRPYFVMELVKGIPITEYCDQSNLSAEERLELFVSVCQAVHHAHQKGVIHRDIKPSNILVTLHDGTPVVKVIDFGVAKAINQRLTERTLFTKFAQLVGTPMYMSPEQAEMSGLDVDTRTDTYSLGVVLYELLTGVTPFDQRRLCDAGYDEIRRIIRDEDPPKPSTKISTLGDTATGVCAHRKTEPKRLSALLRGDLDWIVMKAMEKDRTRRYETTKDLALDVVRYLNHQPVEASPPSTLYRVRKFVRRNRVALGVAATVAVLLVALAAGVGMAAYAQVSVRAREAEAEIARRDAKEAEKRRRIAEQEREQSDQKARDLEWLRNTALPGIQKLKDDRNWSEAFALAEQARSKFPDDPAVLQCWQEVSSTWSVASEPPGAKVSLRPYGDAENGWAVLGKTPLNRIPAARGFYHWKIEKDGFDLVEGCGGPDAVDLKVTLDVTGTLPPGMVRVAASMREGESEFFIDRYEVTNKQFKAFVDGDGYTNLLWWHHGMVTDDGREFSPKDAIARFVDSTGKPGPSTWRNGTYPDGEGDYPVRGICWYEAAAYAVRASKSLPTIYDWQLASGRDYEANIVPASNFASDGAAPVGNRPGVGPFGTYDMAGNVKEWCWNEGDSRRRYILGGAWSEPEYLFTSPVSLAPMDRSATNGFRCALYRSPPSEQLLAPLVPNYRDYSKEKPVSDQEFEAIRRAYAYEARPLNASVAVVEETEAYRHEIATFDAAYGKERMIAHLFLPRRSKPPYQTVIYYGGGDSFRAAEFYRNVFYRCSAMFVIETGRAVVWPVYKGTFERGGGQQLASLEDRKQQCIQRSHDLRTTIDYLFERDDINRDKLAYFGSSAGANTGPILLAMEDRIATGILLNGGLGRGTGKPAPELDPFNFAPRVKIPILMINGRTDDIFPLEVSQVPLFDALGTSETDKSHRVFLGGHAVAHENVVNETLAWLDRYLGAPGSAGPVEAKVDPLTAAKREEDAGNLFFSWAKYAEAEKRFTKALELGQPTWGVDSPERLRLEFRLATTIEKLGRNDEAMGLLERTLRSQQKALGAEHADVRETRAALCGLYNKIGLSLCTSADSRRADYDRAAELALRAVDTDPSQARFWLLSYARYRQGDGQSSLDAVQKSLASANESWPGQWFLAAMIYHRLGKPEVARDWYAAACQWLRRLSTSAPLNGALRKEASSLLNLPSGWPPADWTRSQQIDLYTRLIEVQPNLARLYHCRGSHYGALEKWTEAAADYAKAAELAPEGSRHWEAYAAACLASKDSGAYEKACREAFARFHADRIPSVRLDWVLLCALGSPPPVDIGELRRIAEETVKDPASRNSSGFLALVPGMTLFRNGHFEEALEILPTSGFSNPKDEILAIIFRAMTHARLGDAYTSRRLLQQAHQEIARQLTPLDGPELPYQDRAVVWSMVQAAVREAEAMIGSSGKEPAATTESEQKGHGPTAAVRPSSSST